MSVPSAQPSWSRRRSFALSAVTRALKGLAVSTASMGSLPAQEGIASAFRADSGFGAVAGKNPDFIRQCQQAGMDGVDDLIEIAAGKIGASDAAFKERVSGHQQLERGKVQADRALRVPGSVDDLSWVASQTHNLAIGQAFIRRRGLRRRNADP